MNGKEDKDYYYMQLLGLKNVEVDELETINKCITKAKVYWFEDNGEMKDYTKCTHYSLCKKKIDWITVDSVSALSLSAASKP